jgi:hypothetical protein
LKPATKVKSLPRRHPPVVTSKPPGESQRVGR